MKNILSPEKINEIKDLCDKYKISEYMINNDGSIDVNDNVSLINYKKSKFPLKFNNIKGNFQCSDSNLTTLENGPVSVSGSFNCSYNKLTSLEFGPKTVGGSYYCFSNSLTSLKGAPEDRVKFFNCSKNKLTSLEFSPKEVLYKFVCFGNQLTHLIGCPELNDLYDFSVNPLPKIVYDKLLIEDNIDTINLFVKYQVYYEVWADGFNEDNFNDLIIDIKEGLE